MSLGKNIMDNILCYLVYKNACYINPTYNLTQNLGQIRQVLIFKEFLRIKINHINLHYINHVFFFNEKPVKLPFFFFKHRQGS